MASASTGAPSIAWRDDQATAVLRRLRRRQLHDIGNDNGLRDVFFGP